MPANAGRVRMPHNNRMSTSASLKSTAIWQKAIGHDPYAGEGDHPDDANVEAGQEQAKKILELARKQNLTDGANRDDFARKLYLGLKGGKKRRADVSEDNDDERRQQELQKLLESKDSSSEDEFVVAERKPKKEKRKKHSKKNKHEKRKRDRRYSSDDSGSSSDEDSSSESDRRRRRKSKKKRKHSHRKSSSDDDSSSADTNNSSSSSNRERRHRKRHRRGKHQTSDKMESDSKVIKSGSDFVPEHQYSGHRKGYYFRNGEKGLGYYRDRKPRVDQQAIDAIMQLG